MSARSWPNILITGTPGTGKTTHAAQLVEALQQHAETSSAPWQHLNVGDFVKEKGCHSGWNEEWQSWDVDEDKLLDELELVQGAGAKVLDWHTCDLFPERWIDLVVVLRCDHSQLWNRLEKRGYKLNKIQENNDAEIMEVVLNDARESYAEEIVVVLQSETPDQMEENVGRIIQWVTAWRENNADDEDEA
ncbi:nucleoside-triphosphatase [Rhodotorula paludigena]|uniref:nucleoside-triphosphatase n=1 Tax=Rhodotorula paludigena TaxID=86838 RepID=UPI0031817EF8